VLYRKLYESLSFHCISFSREEACALHKGWENCYVNHVMVVIICVVDNSYLILSFLSNDDGGRKRLF
jgi:hypothetical protein